jgi:cell fate regulator YaaT (PSP1 superfamily)
MSNKNDIINEPVNNEATVPAQEQTVEIVGVSFREAGKIYYFAPDGERFSAGEHVIVDTARGTEMGTVKIENKTVSQSEVVSPLKQITRRATKEDLLRDAKNHEMEMEAALICKRKIAAHGLGMRLVGTEYTFDNSKLIFYFTCESRVDFRELVKDLAATFRTRIELRQIGIRDAAKLMGGIGVCGRKYCCAGFLTDFVQVSIKMAKEQNFSLNSQKGSGACGRLMCCLRYEHETYESLLKVTPPQGTVVSTPDGEGVVVEIKPLAAEVRVRLNDNEKDAPKLYSVKDVRILKLPKRSKQKQDADDESDEIPED